MRLMRFEILFVLGVAALGMGIADIAAAQPFPFPLPGRPGVAPPRPRVAERRVPVVTHPGWPLKRPPRPVVVRPPQPVPRVRVAPRLFLPPVVFGGGVVVERRERRYGRDRGFSRESLVWQDSVTLDRDDEWTEFTLDCNARGTKLWFEVTAGRVQVDWAEVVFESGEVQVVEFPERSMGLGLFELLDFRQGRRVDYVRVVAQAASREAKLALWLER